MSSSINFKKVKDTIFRALKDDKRREVLRMRFGLDGNKKETLEVIGRKFGVTRERVRQIENIIFKEISSSPSLKKTLDIVSGDVSRLGGIVSEERLRGQVGARTEEDSIILSLLLLSSDDVIYTSSRYFKSAWRSLSLQLVDLDKIAHTIVLYLKENKRPVGISEIISNMNELIKDYPQSLIQATILSTSLIDKDVDGNYGLVSWGVIKPKNTRDKAYVIFRKVKKPLHYKTLTDLISKGDFASNKKVSIEAVHNELIRDTRFILVGRGIYALSEWGYHPGTVADVIEEIFKLEGRSMHKDEIIRKVLEKRFVRKNTILLNLQEKPQFKRVRRAVYEYRG